MRVAVFSYHFEVREIQVIYLSVLALVLAEASWADEAQSPAATRQQQFWVDNPGSIIEELKEDAAPKESLVESPGYKGALEPWYAFKEDFFKRHGLRFGASLTTVYQRASNTVGPERDAFGFDLEFEGAWIFGDRADDNPSMIGFQLLYRGSLGTDIPPVALFSQAGSLYSTAAGYADIDPTVGQLWLLHKFDSGLGLRVGRLLPLATYDFFPLKNPRLDYLDFNHAANAGIPLPDAGLGAVLQYRPRPNAYVRFGLHDANADFEEFGADTLFEDGELFKILEVGFDPGITPSIPGRPPFGDVHLTLWHQDERVEEGVDDAWGAVLSASQRFGSVLPYGRYAYSSSDDSGPAFTRHMVNVGIAFDGMFGQSDDRLGLGITWSKPADRALDEQGTIDFFYRIQFTREIALTPTLHIVFDPVRNSTDTLVIGGLRARAAF